MTVTAVEPQTRPVTMQLLVAARCAKMLVAAAAARPRGEEPREYFRTINRVAGIVAGVSIADSGGASGSRAVSETAQELCEAIGRAVELSSRPNNPARADAPERDWAVKAASIYLGPRVAATLVEAGL